MADTQPGREFPATRVALAVVCGVTLALVAVLLLWFTFDGPAYVATGVLGLGLGIVAVAGWIATVGANTDRNDGVD